MKKSVSVELKKSIQSKLSATNVEVGVIGRGQTVQHAIIDGQTKLIAAEEFNSKFEQNILDVTALSNHEKEVHVLSETELDLIKSRIAEFEQIKPAEQSDSEESGDILGQIIGIALPSILNALIVDRSGKKPKAKKAPAKKTAAKKPAKKAATTKKR